MKRLRTGCLVLAFCGSLLALAWLLTPRMIVDGPDVFARGDISKLVMAVEEFRLRYAVHHLPSRIKLSENCNYPQRDQSGTLDADSVAFLSNLWPLLKLSPGTEIDWNGDGKVGGDWVLEGDECLVFFLGGVTKRGDGEADCCGFSSNPRFPLARDLDPRKGPFFPFHSSRLRDLHGRGFFSYLDLYGEGQPYAYFSAYRVRNGYNRYGGTDCPSLGVWPYAMALRPEPRFLNPNSYQIISAGADGKFGPGSKDEAHVWTPDTAASIPEEGRDDLSNFCERRLGLASTRPRHNRAMRRRRLRAWVA